VDTPAEPPASRRHLFRRRRVRRRAAVGREAPAARASVRRLYLRPRPGPLGGGGRQRVRADRLPRPERDGRSARPTAWPFLAGRPRASGSACSSRRSRSQRAPPGAFGSVDASCPHSGVVDAGSACVPPTSQRCVGQPRHERAIAAAARRHSTRNSAVQGRRRSCDMRARPNPSSSRPSMTERRRLVDDVTIALTATRRHAATSSWSRPTAMRQASSSATLGGIEPYQR